MRALLTTYNPNDAVKVGLAVCVASAHDRARAEYDFVFITGGRSVAARVIRGSISRRTCSVGAAAFAGSDQV